MADALTGLQDAGSLYSDTSQGTGVPDTSGGTSGISGSSALGLGTLALGGAGLGAILARGESPLPPEFSQLTGSVPGLQSEADVLKAESNALTAGGTSTLDAASKGILTPEQQAQLTQYGTGLTNQARQQFYGMGRNPDQDTAFISQTADIDAKVNAMAQQQIQSSIALGLGEISSGASFAGQSLGFTNAANQALITAGQAQITADKSYSDSLTNAFSSISKMFAQAAPAIGMALL
jgi:hypothetical protein